jgi:hypothetical protein
MAKVGPIYCELVETAEEILVYYALSYTWGNPTADSNTIPEMQGGKFIYCNEAPLPVTEKLFDCLYQLREGGIDKYLWIDAICINQADTAERNAQVQRMGDTYANARIVFIWLGKADANTEEAISLIEAFYEYIENASISYDFDQLVSFTFNDPAFYALTNPPMEPPSLEQWALINDFLTRKYFGRLWVMQEIMLAKTIYIACGQFEVGLRPLLTFCTFLFHCSWHIGISHLRTPARLEYEQGIVALPKPSAVTFLWLAATFETCKDSGPEHPLQQSRARDDYGATSPTERCLSFLSFLIQCGRTLHASEPMDYVFAPLSLVSRFLPSGLESALELREWLTPDYSREISEVFLTTSILLLGKLLLLSFLERIEDRGDDQVFHIEINTLSSNLPS